MHLSQLTPAEASALAVRTLGLGADAVDLSSKESLAASLRRAASFMCPTSPGRLIDAVMGTIGPLIAPGDISRDGISELLDLLIAEGDLLELRHDEHGRSVRLLYLGPPSFVELEPGRYSVFGVRPFGAQLVDFELAALVAHEGHTRTVHIDSASAAERFAAAGLRPITRDRWIAAPSQENSDSLIARIKSRLDAAAGSGDIDGLQILDPVARTRYYRGRWRTPNAGDAGDYVARRPQAYGADLWCSVRLEDGRPRKVVEFPIDNPVVPARDEAWRLQMAIDAGRGKPQTYTAELINSGKSVVVRFFSPIPGFAERYLQLIGLTLDSAGALFAYRIPAAAMPDLTVFLTTMLWMKTEHPEGTP
jgi:hypothetical protein